MVQFTAEGGYYFKILSDARKIMFVYAGASALVGYESVNWGEKVLQDGSTLHNRDAFIYGGALTLDVGTVADRIALLANLRERCLWGGDTRKFHTQFGVGAGLTHQLMRRMERTDIDTMRQISLADFLARAGTSGLLGEAETSCGISRRTAMSARPLSA